MTRVETCHQHVENLPHTDEDTQTQIHRHTDTHTHIQMHVRKPLPPTPASDVPVLTVGAADDSPAEK